MVVIGSRRSGPGDVASVYRGAQAERLSSMDAVAAVARAELRVAWVVVPRPWRRVESLRFPRRLHRALAHAHRPNGWHVGGEVGHGVWALVGMRHAHGRARLLCNLVPCSVDVVLARAGRGRCSLECAARPLHARRDGLHANMLQGLRWVWGRAHFCKERLGEQATAPAWPDATSGIWQR